MELKDFVQKNKAVAQKYLCVLKDENPDQRKGLYWAGGALIFIIVACIIMLLADKMNWVRAGDALPISVDVIIHQPAERTINLLYQVFNTDDGVIIELPEEVVLQREDTLVTFRKDVIIPETAPEGAYTFHGSVIDQNKQYVVAEFAFRVLTPFVAGLLNFIFFIFLAGALVQVFLAWKSYKLFRDKGKKDTRNKRNK